MPDTSGTTQKLNLPEELVLMLLNEQTGYFHAEQVRELH